MSVPKWKQSESDAEFLRKIRELKIMNVRKCAKIPNKLQRSVGDSLRTQAANAKRLVIKANSIYPENQQEAEDRRRGFKLAIAELVALSADADDLVEMCSYNVDAVGEWQRLIGENIRLLKGVLDGDRRRYKNLPGPPPNAK